MEAYMLLMQSLNWKITLLTLFYFFCVKLPSKETWIFLCAIHNYDIYSSQKLVQFTSKLSKT